ncbi:glycosyltransferase [Patescibacteria group bacterium]|nr:MAG: glycosyltransferase [Patescibacteria group bacterium]
MTIHFFTYTGREEGCSRLRAFMVAEELKLRGFDTVVHSPPIPIISKTPWPRKGPVLFRMLRSIVSIRKGDIIFLQRAIANKYFSTAIFFYLMFFRNKMIFDFDDPIYLHNYFKTRLFSSMANAVIVSSHGQREWALQFNSNVHLLHISLDVDAYKKFTKVYEPEQYPLVIGWVGTAHHNIEGLTILARIFRELLTRNPPVFIFRIIGSLKNKSVYDLFTGIHGLNVEFIDELDWLDSDCVPSAIQKFDIGVLPHRSDGPWNESKTALKMLEYMACGVATVVSNFGEMPHVISDGVDGFLAESESDFSTKLLALLEDQNLRARIGAAGQETALKKFNFKDMVSKVEALIKAL